jgi:iron(III) transport system ATP-binding protein
VTAIDCTGIRVRTGNATILDGLDLALADQEILVVTGPSGAGKSTLVRVLLGLVAPDAGCVRIEGKVASAERRIVIAPEHRGLGAVFQDLALWPHLTVHANLGFGLADLATEERDTRISDMLRRVDLADKARRRPGELSGGERQRVAIARALIGKPRAVLMDEPLSNLDVVLASELLALFRELVRDQGVPALFITHDPREAELGDRVAVIEAGRISQTGTLAELRAAPATAFVRRFTS